MADGLSSTQASHVYSHAPEILGEDQDLPNHHLTISLVPALKSHASDRAKNGLFIWKITLAYFKVSSLEKNSLFPPEMSKSNNEQEVF